MHLLYMTSTRKRYADNDLALFCCALWVVKLNFSPNPLHYYTTVEGD